MFVEGFVLSVSLTVVHELETCRGGDVRLSYGTTSEGRTATTLSVSCGTEGCTARLLAVTVAYSHD